MMTYPHIGNYGVNEEDIESARVQAAGFVVREYHAHPSNWRGQRSLGEYLEAHRVVGIEGIDTRALTRHLRTAGVMEGIISSVDLDPASLVHKAGAIPAMEGRDLVHEVSCREPFRWTGGGICGPGSADLRVVAYD